MTILGAFLMAALTQPAPTEITASDDVWVYPHAGPQDEDQYLRVWGAGDYAVGAPSVGSFDFSYSLLKFSIPKTDAKPVKAVLVLTHVANPAYTEEEFKKYPLEARLAPSDWNENKWTFEMADKNLPGKEDKDILGTATRGEILEDKPIRMEIVLKKTGEFHEFGETLSIALTSKMDPESMNGRMYKLYSRQAADPARQPRLVLTY